MCASSRRPWLRRISERKIAHRLIVANWIFHLLYHIPAWICPTIISGQCMAASNTAYATFLTVHNLTQGLFIPSMMILCGLITAVHLKNMKNRVAPQNSEERDERQVIGQLLSMLFIQVVSDVLFNIPYPTYLVYSLIRPGPLTMINAFLLNMSFNSTFIYYSIGFYLYTLSSRSFRQKLFKLFRQMKLHPRQLQTETNAIQNIGMTAIRMGQTTV